MTRSNLFCFTPTLISAFFSITLSVNCYGQSAPSDVFISEYMEGASNNKFIEIYNGSGSSVDFSDISVKVFSNGSSTASSTTALSGTGVTSIADGETWVICHSSAVTDISSRADQQSGNINFNGDDAVQLVWTPTSAVLDVFGYIGCDPGSQWTGVGNGTQNNILYRNSSYCVGASNPSGTCNATSFTTFTTTNWNSRNTTTVDTNTTDGIGYHDASCGSTSPVVAIGSDSLSLTTLEGLSTEALDSIDISGSNLTANATISVTGNFEISFSLNSGYSTSLTAVHSGGTITDKVYVKLNSGLSPGIYVGNVIIEDGANVADDDTCFVDASVGVKLYPGDMVMVGFDTYTGSGGPDQISLLTLTDISKGTHFTIGNLVFEYNALKNQRTNRWFSGNGNLTQEPAYSTITYIGSGLTAGDIICITLNTTGSSVSTIEVNGTTSSDFENDGRGFINVSSSSPDAIWVFQDLIPEITTGGTGNKYLYMPDARVLAGVQCNGSFQPFSEHGNAGGSRISRSHPDIECFAISTGTWTGSDGWYGYYDMSVDSGSQYSLLSAITDTSNWTMAIGGYSANDLPASTCNTDITVTSSFTRGQWNGGESGDENNWYNCRNWDDFTVPDDSTDVVIMAASPTCIIDTSFANAGLFGDTASCRNILINDSLIIPENGGVLKILGALEVSTSGYLGMVNTGNTEGGEIYVQGDFDLTDANGFSSGSHSKVTFKGNDRQFITCATGVPAFADLAINNPNHIELDVDVDVETGLLFEEGRIYLKDNDLTLLRNSSISGSTSATEMIVADESGTVAFQFDASESFLFPIGDSSGNYTPIELSFNSLNLNGNLFFDPKISVVDEVHPNAGSANPHITRYWDVDATTSVVGQSSLSGFNCDVDVYYIQDDVVLAGAATEAQLVSSKWNGTWALQASSVNTTTNVLTFSGATAFSNFTGLPIKWLDINATAFDGYTEISWSTASEENADYYEIEKSIGLDFKSIGSISARGAIDEKSTYSFIDNSVHKKAFYRIKQIDIDGLVDYSEIVEVNRSGLSDLSIYNQEVGLEIVNSGPLVARYSIIDLSGKIVANGVFKESIKLNSKEVQCGMYLVLVQTSKGQLTSKWVVYSH